MNWVRQARGRAGLSQRALAERAGVAYKTVQLAERDGHDLRASTASSLARALGVRPGVHATSTGTIRDACREVERRGFGSWTLALPEFFDEFRRNPAEESVRRRPSCGDPRLQAMAASVVEALCAEQKVAVPSWCASVPPLRRPWFPSGIQSLKASALVECPAWFRRRNIFVLGNFLARA